MVNETNNLTPSEPILWHQKPLVQAGMVSFGLSMLVFVALMLVPTFGRLFALNSPENHRAILEYEQLYSPEQYPEKLLWLAKKNPESADLQLEAGSWMVKNSRDWDTALHTLSATLEYYSKKETRVPLLLNDRHRRRIAETAFYVALCFDQQDQLANTFNLFSYAMELDSSIQQEIENYIDREYIPNSIDQAFFWYRANKPDKVQQCLAGLEEQRNWNLLAGYIARDRGDAEKGQRFFEKELSFYPDNMAALLAKQKPTNTSSVKNLLKENDFSRLYPQLPTGESKYLHTNGEETSMYSSISGTFINKELSGDASSPLYLLAVTGKDYWISPLIRLSYADGTIQYIHLTSIQWEAYEIGSTSSQALQEVRLTLLNASSSKNFTYSIPSEFPETSFKNRHLTTSGLLWRKNDGQ